MHKGARLTMHKSHLCVSKYRISRLMVLSINHYPVIDSPKIYSACAEPCFNLKMTLIPTFKLSAFFGGIR